MCLPLSYVQNTIVLLKTQEYFGKNVPHGSNNKILSSDNKHPTYAHINIFTTHRVNITLNISTAKQYKNFVIFLSNLLEMQKLHTAKMIVNTPNTTPLRSLALKGIFSIYIQPPYTNQNLPLS